MNHATERSAAGTAEAPAGPAPVPWMEISNLTDGRDWLTAGVTWRGKGEPADMGLFGSQPVGPALARWRALREVLGFEAILHSRQVHGRDILDHGEIPPGFHLAPDADGHVTGAAGVLVTVSVADCVPIWIVDPAERRIALLHAGWRGIAAGIFEAGLDRMRRGPSGDHLEVHLGPSICGRCYEVGPDVHAALDLDVPEDREPVDLRAVLKARARQAGIAPSDITSPPYCTRCDSDLFFSHRGGSTGRQIAFAGIRA